MAALVLGADGMNMGTRFLATQEAPVHPNVKAAIVAADERDTRLIMRGRRDTERVLTNPAVERIVEKEKVLGAAIKFDDIADDVVGVYRRIMEDGETEIGAWSCAMVAGLIKDVPTCRASIDRIVGEAEADEIAHARFASIFGKADLVVCAKQIASYSVWPWHA